jgi:Gti1/Pac2 family transcription factor
MISRITQRLMDSERKMIISGSVFVFDEDKSGIKHWTDGFFRSSSRILGNFLLYHETKKRGAGHKGPPNDAPDQGDQFGGVDASGSGGGKLEGQRLSRPHEETTRVGINRQCERSLVGSRTNSYKFKMGGMMKKVWPFVLFGIIHCRVALWAALHPSSATSWGCVPITPPPTPSLEHANNIIESRPREFT